MHTFCSGRWSDSLEICHKFVCAGKLLEQIKCKEEDKEKSRNWRRNKRKKNFFERISKGGKKQKLNRNQRRFVMHLSLPDVIYITDSKIWHCGLSFVAVRQKHDLLRGLHVFNTELLIYRYPKPNRKIILALFLTGCYYRVRDSEKQLLHLLRSQISGVSEYYVSI